jgi:hypothetical protein
MSKGPQQGANAKGAVWPVCKIKIYKLFYIINEKYLCKVYIC